MKSLYPITLILFILLTGCASSKTTARLTLYLDENFNKEEQTCYIWGVKTWISANEFGILDSARIKPHQEKVRFKVECPIENQVWTFFSKHGPTNKEIDISPKAKVKMYLKPSLTDLNGELEVTGKGLKAETAYKKFLTTAMDPLQYKIENTDNTDSMDIFRHQMADSLVLQIKTTPYPYLAFSYYIMLRTNFSKFLKEGELGKLKALIQGKFSHPTIQILEKYDKVRPMSEKSKNELNILKQVRKKRNEALKQDTAIGSAISLTLYGVNGKLVSIKEIDSEYLLVDFWASWCKPCQKEVPYLKKALTRYKDRLSIYAVSIDRYPGSWQKAIARDKSEDFIHVIGSDRQGLPNATVHGLGVKSIPTNFLLDKNRCIIAKNLRGNKLIQVLDSIMKQ